MWRNRQLRIINLIKTIGFVDQENIDEKLGHKSCKTTFFKYYYLNSQPHTY